MYRRRKILNLLPFMLMLQTPVSLASSSSLFPKATSIEESGSEILIDRYSIEENKSDDFLPLSRIVETTLSDESENSSNQIGVESFDDSEVDSQEIENKVMPSGDIALFDENAPKEALMKSQKLFRSLFSDTIVFDETSDPRFIGSLANSDSSSHGIISEGSANILSRFPSFIKPTHKLAENGVLASDKVYSVAADGSIYEVAPTNQQKTTSKTVSMQTENKKAPLSWLAESVNKIQTGSKQTSYPEQNVSRNDKTNLNEFSLKQEASQSQTQLDASANQLVSIGVKINVPLGIDASRVIIRVAGTSWQVTPDAEGYVSFQNLREGSKLQLLIWDIDGVLTRRFIPIAVSGKKTEHTIEMHRVSDVDIFAAAAGVRQRADLSGFCGRLIASQPSVYLGAQVWLPEPEKSSQVYYVNSSHYPDPRQIEISDDGRFCVFNTQETIFDFTVALVNGSRRKFTVHLLPSTFESNIDFDVSTSVYRPVVGLEPIDTTHALAATQAQTKILFGDGAGKRWLYGYETPIWSRVERYSLSGERGFAPQFIDSVDLQNNQLVYFSAGQEFNTVEWSRFADDQHKAFSLEDKWTLLQSSSAILKTTVQKEELSLHLFDSDLVSSLDSMNSQGVDTQLASAFVSINIAKLGIEYKNLRIILKDVWTSQPISKFQYVQNVGQSTNPVTVRGFFTNLPKGVYVLLISDADGALKWTDVVRAVAGQTQVISIGE